MGGMTSGEHERRLARAAELRAARNSGGQARDVDEDGDEEGRRQRNKISNAAKADYLIRDAMARGEFDNLEYAGKPIPGLGERYDPDWWIKGLIQRENITGLGPAAIMLRTEDAELDQVLDKQYTEKQVREIVEDFNTRVIEARRQLLGGPPVITKTRDVDGEVARWRERKAARAAAAPVTPEPEIKRPWWRRIWSRPS
ncbi:DUF1992 domain-containing protein [Arthrobacter crystallopoietes]|uniref:DnaJ family domain-containing protein n=1 Tax=Crystallibacter crystallopoietes TaxID=37928 RepID=UPI001ABEDACB|nr:DUF1992 domain-containing protein [Arthrobacter crystallopoietes]QTG80026.1 DUF1992 domain-containing protein [Arthrobacter crystallopoietes]